MVQLRRELPFAAECTAPVFLSDRRTFRSVPGSVFAKKDNAYSPESKTESFFLLKAVNQSFYKAIYRPHLMDQGHRGTKDQGGYGNDIFWGSLNDMQYFGAILLSL